MIGVARSGWVKGTEHAIVRLATDAGAPTRTVGAASSANGVFYVYPTQKGPPAAQE